MKYSRRIAKIGALLLILCLVLSSCSILDGGLNSSEPNDTDKPQNTGCMHTVTAPINVKSATCEESGYTGDSICTLCNALIAAGSDIPKSDHTFDGGKCTACGSADPSYKDPEIPEEIIREGDFNYSEVPEFAGENYVVINGNTPYFTADEMTSEAFELYGELDELGRCTAAFACLGTELFPTGTRPSLSFNPTGWVQNSYPSNIVPQTNIYNRSHLIAWALSGEGNNKNNLMTGTPYFNQIGMQIFENQILAYIRETSNHVMYRVTPIFVGNNLVANGALMEAWSVEDNGDGICFNVFMYNVQPGITIDYATGENHITATDDSSDIENAPIATLVTDISQLYEGARIVIVAKSKDYALGSQNTNNRVAAAITKDASTVKVTDGVQIITVGAGVKDGTYSLAVDGGYLYAASSDKNQLKTESGVTANGSWSIEIKSDGTATIKASGTSMRNWLRFNSQNCLFSTYASGQTDICIYIISEN